MDNHHDGISAYLNAIHSLQDGILQQTDALGTIADAMADAVMQERRIFLFGTGHSHMVAEEGHYRAGGLACVVPILVPTLMLHESSLMATKIERTLGLSQIILEHYVPAQGELIFIFSASGVNALPVEMALTTKERGLTVIGVTNVSYCKVAPLSAIGKRLIEIVRGLIDVAHQLNLLVMNTVGTSQEGASLSTIEQLALYSKMSGADIHHLGDAGTLGIAVPENLYAWSMALRGRRHTWHRMASSLKR